MWRCKMKRYICILSVLFAFMACSRHAYNGSHAEMEAATVSCPVQISIGTAGKVTRGSGPIEEENMWLWKNEVIHVYGFRSDASFDTDNKTDAVKCIIDASKEGRQNGGKVAYVSGGEPYVKWNTEPDWFPKGIKPYHFYAYYLDDYKLLDGDIARTADQISFPVILDGSTDFMSARSHIEDHQLEGRGYTPEQKKILRDHAYSAYSANNGWQPELFFHHHLVRLSFEIYASKIQGANVTVQEISVETPTEGNFIVAHKDTSRIGIDFSSQAKSFLYLMEKDGKTPLKKDTYSPIWGPGFENMDLYSRPKVSVGGSLLVAPADSYRCRIKLKGTGDEVLDDPTEYKGDIIDLTSISGRFEAGKQYIVRLSLKGTPDVAFSTTIVPWDYGGSYEFDEGDMKPTE